MILNMEQYDKLISDVIAIAQDQMDTETLNNLKKVYCKNIRPRELETITNLETFLLALDKRNIISYDNTDILKIIGNKLKNKEITDLITTYNQQFQASETNILYHGKSYGHSNSEFQIINLSNTEKILTNYEAEEQMNYSFSMNPKSNNQHITKKISGNIFSFVDNKKHKKASQTKKCIILSSIAIMNIVLICCITLIILHLKSLALTPMESIENAMPAPIPNFNFGFTLNQPHFYSTVPPDDPDKALKTKVTNCISNHIGKHWIYICRHLNLSESLIDELEIKFLDQTNAYKSAMKEALNEYFSKNPQNWKREILDALKDSKRNDIKKKVEDIFHS
ncbi:uncharacterized protein LOC106650617 isoform X1 [Trichogramma pretiosum]|uniref:uncharacterized protein LOC106650617 isoform X1 n=1 Tax=Trichogramma pretiosum TaxID=7493 RepID=UPI000C71A5FF|nr:uncharacterized protein LOC106650617 isoform X1 [Trichogramma pretiosum]XP_023316026.1 uncharacterized protein LOC106650617 isoform X1 [Trichogramma pretiosum]XP_023316027.1 uncharacterized protein LOC106650617 isoform X1 [Trichogramma pretiosum]XP_023316028.1 uncharacterized protein LOC106650617 isoform X1 [Trichogramma pretiosum]